MTNKQLSIGYVFCLLFSCLLLIVSAIGGQGYLSAFAGIDNYSNVLDDLQRDSEFNIDDYPAITGDGSLQVIQIAESTDGELFVYVYQPSADKLTTATTISIAEQLNNTDDFQPNLYNLELVSNAWVFFKYKVTDFKLSGEKERFYNVIMIQRPYVEAFDGESDNGNVTNRKAYGVGQYWYATTNDDGDVSYKMLETQTVQIINPFTSHIRKRKASTGSNNTEYYQDNYYVAFSTERNIERLISASVEYRIRDYYYKNNAVLSIEGSEFWANSVFSNERPITRDVYADETVDLQQQGFTLLFGAIDLNKSFTWSRIQSSDDFVRTAGASQSDNNEVKKLQWVLLFDETSAFVYEDGSLVTVYEETGQIIDNVTVLRLEFVEDGVTYNLGTVSDTVSGKPPFGGIGGGGGNTDSKGDLPWWVWLLVAVGGVAVVLILVCAFVPGAAPVIGRIFATIGKALLWVILLPFRLIGALFKAIGNAITRRKATAVTTSKPRKGR